MKQGILFLLPALGLACLATLCPTMPIRIVALWTSVAFMCVATGYFAVGGRVFGKRPDGTLSTLGILAFAPYLVLALIIAAVCRWILREPACQQVSERLYLGRRLLGRESRLLDQLQVVAVLDLTAATPEPETIRSGRAYRSVPLLDATAPPLDVLREAVQWVIQQSENGPVYVHCAAGHGRAGLVAGAYLLAIGEAADADDSVQKLQNIRPLVRLSCEQRCRLTEYAATLDRASREQPASKRI